jgi:hypothetical protein
MAGLNEKNPEIYTSKATIGTVKLTARDFMIIALLFLAVVLIGMTIKLTGNYNALVDMYAVCQDKLNPIPIIFK